MQLPLWFSLWQSLDSLLAIALNAAEAFPFLLFSVSSCSVRAERPFWLTQAAFF